MMDFRKFQEKNQFTLLSSLLPQERILNLEVSQLQLPETLKAIVVFQEKPSSKSLIALNLTSQAKRLNGLLLLNTSPSVGDP